MTWFGLALALIAVFASFAWKRLNAERESGTPPVSPEATPRLS